ncbi:uncharacterized protein TNCV_3450561 [Trichonephila clavipes]|uniref:Uncharacterized protein n=1 Tax=Trichonephila clavipes TaxID=2585209 RepID=A0A8X6WJQ9_TRICX|nr:uncharacterized protein TNCV_3450561 [Trichonephila clavipes]
MIAVTLPLVRSNSWDTQLVVPKDPRHARLETNLGIEQAKEDKAGLRHSPWGLHIRRRLSSQLRLNLDSSLKTTWLHSAAIQFSRAQNHSKRRRRWVGVKGSTRNGFRDPKCPSARRIRKAGEDTGAPNKGATCAWMAVDEAVGCMRAFLTMWRSSRRLVYRGRPQPGLPVNDISRIHWSQHLLTAQLELPN